MKRTQKDEVANEEKVKEEEPATRDTRGMREHVHGGRREGWDGFESRPCTLFLSTRPLPATGVVGKCRHTAYTVPPPLVGHNGQILGSGGGGSELAVRVLHRPSGPRHARRLQAW